VLLEKGKSFQRYRRNDLFLSLCGITLEASLVDYQEVSCLLWNGAVEPSM
jgi:hypothetical protein